MSCVLIVFVVPVLPRVKVTPFAKVASPPKVILPVEVSPIVAFAVTEIPVPLSPKVIVAVLEALTDPATFTELGASAVTPAVNVILSELPFPKVTNPVFENVTALVIVFERVSVSFLTVSARTFSPSHHQNVCQNAPTCIFRTF